MSLLPENYDDVRFVTEQTIVHWNIHFAKCTSCNRYLYNTTRTHTHDTNTCSMTTEYSCAGCETCVSSETHLVDVEHHTLIFKEVIQLHVVLNFIKNYYHTHDNLTYCRL